MNSNGTENPVKEIQAASRSYTPQNRDLRAWIPAGRISHGGHGIEEIAARLVEESTKARKNAEAYALLTAQNAAAADARNRQRSRA